MIYGFLESSYSGAPLFIVCFPYFGHRGKGERWVERQKWVGFHLVNIQYRKKGMLTLETWKLGMNQWHSGAGRWNKGGWWRKILLDKACMPAKSLQSCLTLCDPMNCNPPGSSVHKILQARILEWVAIPFSKGSSWTRDWTCVSYVSAGRFFTTSDTWEAQIRQPKLNTNTHWKIIITFYLERVVRKQIQAKEN